MSPNCVLIIRLRSPLISPTRLYVHGDVDAVAACRRRLIADEVIALVDREHEERVALVDAVRGEPVEELPERVVVVLQLLDVAGLAGPVGEVDVARVSVAVVRVRDVART